MNAFTGDLHQSGRAGMLERMLSGTIGGGFAREMLILLGGVTTEFPILMTVLALIAIVWIAWRWQGRERIDTLAW